MTTKSNNFTRKYREARRYRYGFHIQRQLLPLEQRKTLRQKYAKSRELYIFDYDNAVERLHEKNLKNQKDYDSRVR